MKILIIGAGEVGRHIGKTLAGEEHDVTLLDRNPEAAEKARQQLDADVITGNGASPNTLKEIGAAQYRLVIAVTESDEANVIAGLTAAKLGAETVVVRVREKDYFGPDDQFATEELGISFVVHPEQATAEDIAEAILTPGAVRVEYFAEQKLAVAEIPLSQTSPLRNQTPQTNPNYQIVGIENAGKAQLIQQQHTLQAGERMYLTASKQNIAAISAKLSGQNQKVQSAMIFGGGRIGMPLAEKLCQAGINVTVLEKDGARAQQLAEQLAGCEVIHEEGVSKEALIAQGVENSGAFIAAAGDDRANLLAAQQAKSLGAGLCIAVISREEFVPLTENLSIDAAYAPRLVAAEAILRFARGRDIKAMHLLFSGCQVLEIEVEAGAKVEGRQIQEIEGWRTGAIVRQTKVIIPQPEEKFEAGDTILLFGSEKASRDIEQYFHRQ